MNPLPISARRLRHCTLRMKDRRLRGAAVCPFFDRTGRVSHLMILPPDGNRIHFVPWLPDDWLVPLFGPVKLRRLPNELPDIGSEATSIDVSLVHYDPWWLLDAPRYAHHGARAQLKATNCVGRLTKVVRMVYFHRDLSRATWVVIRRSRSRTEMIPWRADLLLPPREPQERQRRATPGEIWQLDPIWLQW
jgi:hypothetical protein